MSWTSRLAQREAHLGTMSMRQHGEKATFWWTDTRPMGRCRRSWMRGVAWTRPTKFRQRQAFVCLIRPPHCNLAQRIIYHCRIFEEGSVSFGEPTPQTYKYTRGRQSLEKGDCYKCECLVGIADSMPSTTPKHRGGLPFALELGARVRVLFREHTRT